MGIDDVVSNLYQNRQNIDISQIESSWRGEESSSPVQEVASPDFWKVVACEIGIKVGETISYPDLKDKVITLYQEVEEIDNLPNEIQEILHQEKTIQNVKKVNDWLTEVHCMGSIENDNRYIELLDQSDGTDFSSYLGRIREEFPEEPAFSFAIAGFVNKHKIVIINFKDMVTEQELLNISLHLHYLNLMDLSSELSSGILSHIENEEKTGNIYELYITDSTIEKLPALPNLQKLFCMGCSKLTSLPDSLSKLQKLDCIRCPIRSLPYTLSSLELLVCNSCPISSLPDNLSSLKTLKCSNCPIRSLPDNLFNLQNLHCIGCSNLTSLSAALPNCTYLVLRNCPRVEQYPELPFNARTFSSPEALFQKMEVDIEALDRDPIQYLQELGNKFLLRNRPFPNIYYIQDGQLSEAIDVGGVRRDIVTRLFETLFSEKNGRKRLPYAHEEGEETILPEDDGSEEASLSYQTLGKLLALCYPENSFFKTGGIFDSRFFKAMTKMKNPENPSDDEIIESYLHIKVLRFPSGVLSLTTEECDLSAIDKDAFIEAAYLIDPEWEDFGNERQFFENADNRRALREAILNEAKADPRLKAIQMIASSMKEALGEETWEAIQTEGAEKLEERIQGKLDATTLKNQLHFEANQNVSQDNINGTKRYLIEWIDNASEGQLKAFVRAVTSNNTLGPNAIKVELFNRGPDRIPEAHTCFFTLELSAEYPNQETFNEKLKLLLLTEGFQFA